MNATDAAAGVGGSGYTLDELSDYLDRGRTPAIPDIDDNAECQAALASLERLGSLSRSLVVQDARDNPTIDESWLGSLLDTIGREVKAGRDIPLSVSDPAVTLSITEGAVRELVRAAGDSVDGVLVGSCQVDGDIDHPTAGVTIRLTISVVLSAPVHELARAVRERVHTELLTHTELRIDAIDVTVSDVHLLATEIEGDKS